MAFSTLQHQGGDETSVCRPERPRSPRETRGCSLYTLRLGETFYISIVFNIFFSVCGHVWRSEDNWRVSPLSFYRVGPETHSRSQAWWQATSPAAVFPTL